MSYPRSKYRQAARLLERAEENFLVLPQPTREEVTEVLRVLLAYVDRVQPLTVVLIVREESFLLTKRPDDLTEHLRMSMLGKLPRALMEAKAVEWLERPLADIESTRELQARIWVLRP